jgi:nucleotide-binding universal stress UspA family protein
MYRRILVPLENSASDAAILEHIQRLARSCGASLVLIHVADGWVARNIQQLELRESEEMREDRVYLDRVRADLAAAGFDVEAVLGAGDPAREIAQAAEREHCDLIAMSTHGHRYLKDLVLGSVANEVRHMSLVPVLLVRVPPGSGGSDRRQTARAASGDDPRAGGGGMPGAPGAPGAA